MTSCVVIHNMPTLQIGIMKQGFLNFPSNTSTVALINSVSNNHGYHSYIYTEHFPYTTDNSDYH